MMRLALLALAAGATNTTDGSGDVMLIPDGAGEAMAVVMLPGAQINAEQYQPLMQQVQAAAAERGIALYVSILHYWLGLVQPADLSFRIGYALKQLQAKGFKGDKVVYAGHSLGGVFIQDYVHGLGKATGQILMGSYLVRKYRGTGYPVPTLTVGGELDGQSRITRIAESWYHSKDPAFPVVVVPEICHMSFASGEAPGLVKSHDLFAEVDEAEGHRRIAAVLGDYLAGKNLADALAKTKELVAPIAAAYVLEGSRSFNAPAQVGGPEEKSCVRGLCPSKSAWVPTAQQLIAGTIPGYTMNISNAYVKLTGFPLEGDDFHLPVITNDTTASGTTISITTYSQGYWGSEWDELFNDFDTAFVPTAALEIGSKLSSRQCVHITGAGQTDTPFSVDASDFCAQANAKAYEWALSQAPAHTLERFKRRGQALTFGKDIQKAGGPLWANARLQFNDQGDHVEVVAAAQATEIDYWQKHFHIPRPKQIPDPGCYHYCKLLSPARAMEWLFVDGLRKNKTAPAPAAVYV